jgi:choloylglycine hydrolase
MNWRALLALGLSLCVGRAGMSCTEVMLPAAGEDWVSMRTMDYPIPLSSKMVTEPRAQSWVSSSPCPEIPAATWKGLYGFVGINALGQRQYPDALNERGLSVSTLVLPGTQYETPSGKRPALEVCDIGAFVAGQCANVEEARALLETVDVWGQVHPLTKEVVPLHIVIHDAQGNTIVVEWLGGKREIHDDPVGVCTNAPALPAQWELLNQYAHLSPKNHPSWIGPEINGSGMKGLPGDATSPSRFARMAVLKRFAPGFKNTAEAHQTALQWMGLVWTPKGMIDSKAPMYTQWGVLRDHKTKSYVVVSESHRAPRKLSLRDLDLSEGATHKSWDLNVGPQVLDMQSLTPESKSDSQG